MLRKTAATLKYFKKNLPSGKELACYSSELKLEDCTNRSTKHHSGTSLLLIPNAVSPSNENELKEITKLGKQLRLYLYTSVISNLILCKVGERVCIANNAF